MQPGTMITTSSNYLLVLDQGKIWALGLPDGYWAVDWPKKAPTALTQISLQNDYLVGLDAQNTVWAIAVNGGEWVANWPKEPPVPLNSITIHKNDYVLGLDANTCVWAISVHGGDWVKDWPRPRE
ncbi:MAG TPA: hypothetical protein VGF67_13610 [Ktedonobacteraceae bacterium]